MYKRIEELISDKYIDSGVELSESKKWGTYSYNGIAVPRVSEILSSMLHEEYLLDWANSLGYRRVHYTDVRDLSASKGTAAHNTIEKFLKSNDREVDYEEIEPDCRLAVKNVFGGFLKWYDIVSANNSLEIVEIEKTVVCPFVGGTLDLLTLINGELYLVDFKTSNHMTYKYFIQLAAYYYILEAYYGIKVKGVLILWFNKRKPEFREYMISFSDPYQFQFINHCRDTFISLVYAYYNRLLVQDGYNNIFKGTLV